MFTYGNAQNQYQIFDILNIKYIFRAVNIHYVQKKSKTIKIINKYN